MAEDAVDFGPQTVMAAGGKRVSVKGGEEYEIDNYIAYYDCRPPTLFIPIITIAEVSIMKSCSQLSAFNHYYEVWGYEN